MSIVINSKFILCVPPFSLLVWILLDEADEMLNMGFREDIETILEYIPEELCDVDEFCHC